MKTRLSFISNSSSSSFVVEVRDENGTESKITEEQKELLLSYGFRCCAGDWRRVLTGDLPFLAEGENPDSTYPLCMTYDVISNEDEAMEFLFGNKIPFVCSEEYNTKIVHYDGEHDYYDTYVNAGEIFRIYGGLDSFADDCRKTLLAKSKPFYRTRISDGTEIPFDEMMFSK